MYTLNSNRLWKRVIAQCNTCNRAARRNAARILAMTVPTGDAPTDTVPSNASVSRVYSRPYVCNNANGERIIIRSASVPEFNDGFTHVMGPFKTMRGAEFALVNPSCPTVSIAERNSKQIA